MNRTTWRPPTAAIRKMPVTLLTGFLGAGKTTLVNRILRATRPSKRIAVIENEFGEIGIDDDLVASPAPEIFGMHDGCICCTVRGDLLRVLRHLRGQTERFDHVLIETTGLADPARVVAALFLDEELSTKMCLDAIVTVVDALHLHLHLDESRECERQVTFANVILLNKIDLVSAADVHNLEMRIRYLNPMARIRRTWGADVDVAEVLDLGAFDLSRALALDPTLLDPADPSTPVHDRRVRSVGIAIPGDLDGYRFHRWMTSLLRSKDIDIFRMKGILRMKGNPRPLILQGVHQWLELGPSPREAGCENKLVLIGRNLDRAKLHRGFRACLA